MTLLIPFLISSFTVIVAESNVIQREPCGTGCHHKIRQLTPMEEIGNGWRKVKVKKTAYLWNYLTKDLEQRAFRHPLGSGVYTGWNYAHCKKELFTFRSKNYFSAPPRPANETSSFWGVTKNVFFNGYPKNSTSSGFLFQQWRAMCPIIYGTKLQGSNGFP